MIKISVITGLFNRITKYPLLSYLIIFLTFFLTLFIGQNIYLTFSSRIQSALEAQRQTKAKESSAQKYQNLLKNQESVNKDTNTTPAPVRNARGNTTIQVILVKPPSVPDTAVASLVSVLKDDRDGIFSTCIGSLCNRTMSLWYIRTFLSRESYRFDVADFDVKFSVKGVYTLKDLEKVGDFANLWNKDPFGVAKVQDAFEATLKNNSLDATGVTLFLYFDDSDLAPTANSDNFYDHKKFRSFANPEKSRAYINIYDFSPFFAKTAVLVTAHELLHLFGASDKYIVAPESDRICQQKGLGQPSKVPLYPQTTGDIMCLFVEKNKGVFIRGSLVDNNLVINEVTAREIGWK